MLKIVITTIGLFLTATSSDADAPLFSIASGEHPPFASADLPEGGIVNEYLNRIAEEAGLEAEFHYMPWTRALEATRNTMYQATSYWYFSDTREADFIHVGPISQEEEVFFVLAETAVPEWENLEDLQGLRIGATLGYTYTSEFWDLADSGVLTLSPAPEIISNFRKLLSGRIDLFPVSKKTGWHMIKNHFSEIEQARFATLKKPLSVHGGYLLVPRALQDGERLAAELQRAVDEYPPE